MVLPCRAAKIRELNGSFLTACPPAYFFSVHMQKTSVGQPLLRFLAAFVVMMAAVLTLAALS
jgi:hypothetical protein